MTPTLRQRLAPVHTWTGVILGSLLFAIFWMGTLSVFDREIDRWMMPATRLQPPDAARPLSLDATVKPLAQALGSEVREWSVGLPTDRVPTLRFGFRPEKGRGVNQHIDPATLATLPDPETHAGTGFIFPFHFRLNLRWMDLGMWIVGVAGMAMLLLIVSGVIIHRRIFIDFFTFRPRKRLQRASLDLHNLTGVVALPFHFVITLSGLIIFMGVYFPAVPHAVYAEAEKPRREFNQEAHGRFERKKSGQPGTLGSLDALVAQAEALWSGGQVSFVKGVHPGDANAYVEVRRSHARDITMNLDQIYFDAASGRVLHRFEAAPVMGVQRFVSGLHFVQFRHWSLRWLYFLAGLAGCVLIATGYLYWLEARRASHMRQGLAGVRIVEALAIGSVTGIIAATLAFFIANRLLPSGAALAGFKRAELEMGVFFLVWIGCFVHAAWRKAEVPVRPACRAWREQAWAIATLSVLAVALNGVTTGHHLPYTLSHGLWAVAGMDLMLLACAAIAAAAALRLAEARRSRGASAFASAARRAQNAGDD